MIHFLDDMQPNGWLPNSQTRCTANPSPRRAFSQPCVEPQTGLQILCRGLSLMFRPEAAHASQHSQPSGTQTRVMCATPGPLLASRVAGARAYISVAEVAR
jgi:hypothetical protein